MSEEHGEFEIKSMEPGEVLASMVDEQHYGSCILPFPEGFMEFLRKEGEVDPDTSQQYFYMKHVKMNGDEELTLLTILEVMQLHEATHRYIKNMIKAISDQVEDE